MSSLERKRAHAELLAHAMKAKREIESVLDCLGWTNEPALSLAIDRLVVLIERLQ